MSDVEQPVTRNEGFRVSQMPATLREDAMALVKEFDANGDGCVDKHEFAEAVKALKESRTKTSQYGKIIAGLSVSAGLLIASMFGVSLVAARLSKDTVVSGFGVVLDKETNKPVKTAEAIEYYDETNSDLRVVDMKPYELMKLKEIVLFDGELSFNVKGHVKTPAGDKVIILVEGGTITYDEQGILDATGDARYMLDIAFGVIDIDNIADEEIESDPEEVAEEPAGDRKLIVGMEGMGQPRVSYYGRSGTDTKICRGRVLGENDIGVARWRRLCGGGGGGSRTPAAQNNPPAQNNAAAQPEPTQPDPPTIANPHAIHGITSGFRGICDERVHGHGDRPLC